MSPLIWDLAHVANYEELWLLRALAGVPAVRPDLDHVYDAFRHPRSSRSELPLLGPVEARSYASGIRERVVELLDRLDLATDASSPLLANAFAHGMVIQHEHQHDETMLATLQLMAAPGYRPLAPVPPSPPSPAGPATADEVLIDGGAFLMGTDTDVWALDNERPAHEVEVAPFWIDRFPVTNGAFAEFIADGGYARPAWWTPEGWAWRQTAGLEHPQFWAGDGAAGWARTRFGWTEPVPPLEPVQHVCWYEADAFARWAGRRLPTETEWEKAASWGPDGRKRRWPWGDEEPTAAHANLGQRHFGPAPVGAYPRGAASWGVEQMVGDVWEWTASEFAPHPGFRSFPYREYSEVFYGPEYKVLRGGSWATDPVIARATFRNWDFPIRRQIFAGFRCARDA
jgi:iron(II)-dependent oxidoreductase